MREKVRGIAIHPVASCAAALGDRMRYLYSERLVGWTLVIVLYRSTYLLKGGRQGRSIGEGSISCGLSHVFVYSCCDTSPYHGKQRCSIMIS